MNDPDTYHVEEIRGLPRQLVSIVAGGVDPDTTTEDNRFDLDVDLRTSLLPALPGRKIIEYLSMA